MKKIFLLIFVFTCGLFAATVFLSIRHTQQIPPDPEEIAAATPSPTPGDLPVVHKCQTCTPTIGNSSDPPPRFDWVKGSTESFVLDPGQVATYGPFTSSSPNALYTPHLLRFDVKASSPVDAGALGAEYMQVADNFFGSAITLCYSSKTLESQHTCRLAGANTQGYILVRDSRQKGLTGNASAIAGAILGVKEPIKQAMRENRVTLTFYQWQCVEFCP